MAVAMSVEWTNLTSFPSSNSEIAVPAGINQDNYIVLEYGENTINFVHKYNIEANKWTTTSLSIDTNLLGSHYPVLDTKQNVLYYIGGHYGTMAAELKLNTKKITKYPHSTEHDYTSKCIILNNELYVIGGAQSHSISKWNTKTNKLIPTGVIYNKIRLDLFGFTCDNNTNSILLFGGFDNENSKRVDYILQYNALTNKCNKLPISLPRDISRACCLKAINETYILIFGGRNAGACIYIYSMKSQTIKRSKIKCPSTNIFSGIVVNDKIKDEKSVFGFVRNTWKTCQIDNHYFPPFYLLKIMHSYYLNEWVFLLDTGDKKHYKMSTLDIVQ